MNHELKQLQDDVREIKDAVVGNQKIGLPGLVTRVNGLEKWVRKSDIRNATIFGGGCVIIFLLELLFKK